MKSIERKVGAGGLAGALSVILVWIISEVGADIPGEVASAITTVLTFVTAWVVPDKG